MRISREEALQKLMRAHGAERADVFLQFVQEVEDDELLLELVQVVPWDARAALNLTYFVTRAVAEMTGDLASLRSGPEATLWQRPHWVQLVDKSGQPLARIREVFPRDLFRNALIAIALLTKYEYSAMEK
ncbi:hypothetical protein HYW59_00195 [Candidatus Kaiserbacteria bacterium]|nr:hypothetical protein [Candidatus Kaiserbacteria bacterium]